MINYRPFRNADPPKILNLFREAGLGRGAACPASVGVFEVATFSLPYFDPAGLIVAETGHRIVGFVHAGFGFTSDLGSLDYTKGVIAAVIVDPEFRRQGIGRSLVAEAEQYLRRAGTTEVHAGESRYRDPFYLGLYGGARPSGFLHTDPLAAPFFASLGYEEAESASVMQRDLRTARDPTTFRMMSLRRQTELAVSDRPESPTWWWYTHFGNIESMRFQLMHRKTHQAVASMTVIGLDNYINAWNETAIGIVDVFVAEGYRGQGYGQTLLVETIRRLRGEMISRAEVHVPASNPVAAAAVRAAGFKIVDNGTVYSRTLSSAE